MVLLSAQAAWAQAVPVMPVAPSAPAAKPDPAKTDAAPDKAAIQRTLDALDDPAKRAELTQTLRALLAAQDQQAGAATAEAKPATNATTDLLDNFNDQLTGIGGALASLTDWLNQLPVLTTWLRFQMTDEWRRQFWSEVITRLGIVLGAGLGVMAAVYVATRRRTRENFSFEGTHGWRKVTAAFERTVLVLAPMLSFIATVLVAVNLLKVDPVVRSVAETLMLGMLAYMGVMIAIRIVLTPTAPSLRPIQLSDEHALRYFAQLRALAILAVTGHTILICAGIVGMPQTLLSVLTHILNLILVALAILEIQRWRVPVERAIIRMGGDGRGPIAQFVSPNQLAGIWHILASGWLILLYLVWAVSIEGSFYIFTRGTIVTLLALIVGRLLLMRIEPPPAAVVPDGPDVMAAPDEDVPPDTMGPIARGVLGLVVRLLVVVVIAEAWGLSIVGWLTTGEGQGVLRVATRLALIGVFAYLGWSLISTGLGRSIDARDEQGNLRFSGRTRTLMQITRNLLLTVVGLIGVLLTLSEIGVDAGPLLAGAGVIGLAVGFGSQRLVQDVIGGFFILFSDTIRVGDVVDIGGKSGTVEGMTIRTVTLRSYDGSQYTVPYSAISVVTNMTRDFGYAAFEFGVVYETDTDKAVASMKDVGDKMRKVWPWYRRIVEPMEIAGIDRMSGSRIVIKARIKTRPGDQWAVGREFQRRIKERFDEDGIKLAADA